MDSKDKPLVEGPKIFSIEEILETATPTQYVNVDVEKFTKVPGCIRLGSLTTDELTEWQDATDERTKKTAGLRLLIQSLVDADNQRIGNPRYIDALKKKSAGMINHLVDEVLKLNHLNVKSDAAKNG